MGTDSAESVRKTVDEREARYLDVDPQQASTRIQTFPAQMSYEAKLALELVKNSDLPAKTIGDIVESFARTAGWAEALAYSADKLTTGQAIKHLISSGKFVPVAESFQQ